MAEMNLSPLGRCYGQTASMRLMLTMWSERALGGPTGGDGPPVTARKNEPQPCLRRRFPARLLPLCFATLRNHARPEELAPEVLVLGMIEPGGLGRDFTHVRS